MHQSCERAGVLRPAVLSAALLLAAAAAAQGAEPPARASGEQTEYFKETLAWSFKWGTDAAFTASNLKSGSTNETNDGTTNFDRLWLRLYGQLQYGDRAKVVIDLFSADASDPWLYGLYGEMRFDRRLGLRAGMLPLTVGAWQERAYPSRQPLIGAPLLAQYLLPVHSASLPTSPRDLVGWWPTAQSSSATAYGSSASSAGSTSAAQETGSAYNPATADGASAAIAYEHCWDTGVELFGQEGGLHYRLAVLAGTPGLPATKALKDKDGISTEGRLTYRVSQTLRLGASFSRGPYPRNSALLPSGVRQGDLRQDLAGGDVQITHKSVTLVAEYLWTRFGTAFTKVGPWPQRASLDARGYWAEVAVEVVAGLTLAGRVSGLRFGSIDDGYGYRLRWTPNVWRAETGVTYRFWDDVAAVKAAYQRTRVDSAPSRIENLVALQLAFSH
jgi:hypothetical protein